MPATYIIDGDVLRIRLKGETPPDELSRCFLTAIADPDCPPSIKLILDAAGSTSLTKRSPAEVRYITQFLRPHVGRIGARCAVIVSSDAEYELVRLGAVYSGSVGVETRGFRTEEAALQWLQSDSDGTP